MKARLPSRRRLLWLDYSNDGGLY